MDKKKELRKKIRAKIRQQKNIRAGKVVHSDHSESRMGNIFDSNNMDNSNLNSLAHLTNNININDNPELNTLESFLKEFNKINLNNKKQVKKARHELSNMVKTQLMLHTDEMLSKTESITEIPEETADKMLLNTANALDDESDVSSDLSSKSDVSLDLDE